MLQFAANLTMLYTDCAFMDRLARAKRSGFHYVEYLFPYEHDINAIASNLQQHDLNQVLFNLPAGNWDAGERGIAAQPDRIDEFRHGVRTAVEIAQVLRVNQLNCLVGKRDDTVPIQDQQRVMIENLRYAAHQLAEHKLRLLVEMLNPYDVPNFLIANPRAAFEIQDQVASPNLKIQYDVYHAQRATGELANTIQQNLDRIGHIQIADNPGRHQPGTGEINYRFLFDWIARCGYTGYIGLEYVPAGTTEQSLNWINEYGYSL